MTIGSSGGAWYGLANMRYSVIALPQRCSVRSSVEALTEPVECREGPAVGLVNVVPLSRVAGPHSSETRFVINGVPTITVSPP
jgi:hypothetical protein